jgi:DNA gyrase/topoisomerase IV subunit A
VNEFERFKAETRLKVLTELLRAQDFGWQLVEAVERCKDKAEARAVLMEPPFGFDALEAEHVLDRTLGQRTKLGIESLAEERDSLSALLAAQ